jgi:hypothetical protein
MSYARELPASTRRLYKDNRLGWQPYGWGGSITYSVAFEDLVDFITVVSGRVETVFSSTTRVVPLRHEDFDQGLIAVNMDLEYAGYNAANSPPFALAIARIDFASPQWPLAGSNAFQVVTRRGGSEVVTMPGTNLFVSGTPLGQDAGVFVATADILVQQFYVPTDDSATLDGLLNKTNNATLFGHAAGTVLFSEYASEYQITTTNTTAYQRSLTLAYRNPSWGYLPSPSGVLGPVTYGDGTQVYQQTDLSGLFPL